MEMVNVGGSGPKFREMTKEEMERLLSVAPIRSYPSRPIRRRSSIDELRQLARSNPIVKIHLDAWEHGELNTLENMLISLACHLADENGRLMELAKISITNDPGLPFYVAKDGL